MTAPPHLPTRLRVLHFITASLSWVPLAMFVVILMVAVVRLTTSLLNSWWIVLPLIVASFSALLYLGLAWWSKRREQLYAYEHEDLSGHAKRRRHPRTRPQPHPKHKRHHRGDR